MKQLGLIKLTLVVIFFFIGNDSPHFFKQLENCCLYRKYKLGVLSLRIYYFSVSERPSLLPTAFFSITAGHLPDSIESY